MSAIRNSGIDPVVLLDYGESLQELKRHGKEPPERPTGMSEYHHWQSCLKVVNEDLRLIPNITFLYVPYIYKTNNLYQIRSCKIHLIL